MNHLRYGNASKATNSGILLGCKYRQRTGACSCDNPPIGCVEPEERGHRSASKPAEKPVENLTQRSSAPPPPLPEEFSLHGSLIQVPTHGWRCTSAEDARNAVAAGLRLLDAHGDADMEGAISAANPKPGVLLCTALPALEELQIKDAEQMISGAASRLCRSSREILFYIPWAEGLRGADDSASLDGIISKWNSIAGTLHGRIGALGLSFPSADLAGRTLRLLQASPGSLLPAVLFVPTSASQPHRALIGLCHRLSVLPVSSSPLSSSGIDTPERLVAWSVARGVPCMLGAEDAANAGFMSSEPLISSLSAPLKPLDAAERAALNALG